MPDFDRDATKKALEWWENSLSLPGRAGREMAGDQLAEAARWAVQITEGDGELWAEKPCDHGWTRGHYPNLQELPHCPGGSRERVWPPEDQ